LRGWVVYHPVQARLVQSIVIALVAVLVWHPTQESVAVPPSPAAPISADNRPLASPGPPPTAVMDVGNDKSAVVPTPNTSPQLPRDPSPNRGNGGSSDKTEPTAQLPVGGSPPSRRQPPENTASGLPREVATRAALDANATASRGRASTDTRVPSAQGRV